MFLFLFGESFQVLVGDSEVALGGQGKCSGWPVFLRVEGCLGTFRPCYGKVQGIAGGIDGLRVISVGHDSSIGQVTVVVGSVDIKPEMTYRRISRTNPAESLST
jgi:hypothetical protein